MGATNLRLLSTALLCIISAGHGMPVEAAPQGGNVVAGQGSIQQSDATTTVVTQASPSLVIDWNSFNVGSAERVQFKQPDAAAAVLNRIGDARPSQIDGALRANGRVFLINPNGLIFGKTAVVNVGSLVAGSLRIASEDFMRGDYRFSAAPGQEGGRVVNHGLLSAAAGGSVTLFGGSVANDGLIVANYGQVNLGAGHKVLLDFDGDGLLRFEVPEPVLSNGQGATTAVANSGSIVAAGGQVLLTASAAKDVFTRAVNNSGVIQAVGVDKHGGVVRLVGAGGVVANGGTLDASSADGKGGTIDVLGDQVALSDGAQLDASGGGGGGIIRVGGDYQGKNPAITNAQLTYVGHQVSLKADAVAQGDGGKIVVWSDHDTNYFGAASARGGALSGNGGTAEVSGKGALTYAGTVDLRAPSGVNGSLLLDPTDITISSGGVGASSGTLTLGATISESGTATASTLTDGDLNTQLGLSSVTVTTNSSGAGTGNLVVDGAAAINGSGNNLALTSVGSGTVTLDGTITYVGSLTLNSAGGIVTGTGSAAGSNLLTGVTDFNVSTHQSHGVTYSGFITVSGSGQLDNLGGSYNDGLDSATVGGVTYNSFATINGATGITNAGAGFNAGTRVSGNGNSYGAGFTTVAGSGTLSGVSNYNAATQQSGTVTYSGFTTVSGSGQLDNLGGSYNDGLDSATVGGVTYTSFATINGATGITNAGAGFNAGTRVSGNGNSYGAGYTTVAGAGTLSGVSNYDAATQQSGTVTYSGFSAVGGSGSLSGISNYDVATGSNGTVSFSGFTTVNGSGQLDNLGGSYNDGLDTATVGGVNYNSFATINGATGITNAGAGFNAGTGVSGNGNRYGAGYTTVVGLGTLSGITNYDAATGSDGGVSYSGFTVLVGVGGGTLSNGNVWNISGPDSGTVDGLTFSNFRNLTGTAGGDSFVFAASGSLSGVLDGAAGSDMLDLSAYPTARNMVLTGAGVNGFNGTESSIVGGFANVEALVAPAGTVNSLQGADLANSWAVTGTDAGILTAGGSSLSFSNFRNLTGGSANDVFSLSGGTLSGMIDGGAGTNTLTADNVANAWTIAGMDSGTVTGLSGGFNHIQTLVGGAGSDRFVMESGGAVSGVVGGGEGADVLDYRNFSGDVVVDLGLNSATGIGGIANIETVVGGTGGNTLQGPNAATDWRVLGPDTVTANDSIYFEGFHNLQGGTGADHYDIGADFTGSINGGGGADMININAPVHTGRLDLTADEVNFTAPGQINAGGGAVTITAGAVNADQKDVHIIADSLVLHAADHAGTYALPIGLEISTATDFGTGSRNFVSGFFGATQGDFTDVGKTTLNIYRGQSAVVQDRGKIDPALFIKDFNLFSLIDGGVRLTPDQREE